MRRSGCKHGNEAEPSETADGNAARREPASGGAASEAEDAGSEPRRKGESAESREESNPHYAGPSEGECRAEEPGPAVAAKGAVRIGETGRGRNVDSAACRAETSVPGCRRTG